MINIIKYKLKYASGILFPIVGLSLILFSIGYAIIQYKKLTPIGWGITIGAVIIGILLIKIFSFVRKAARQALSSDEYGNKTRTYKDMSKQERLYIDLLTTAQDEQLLSTAEYTSMIKPGAQNPTEALNSLIGLKEVKQKVSELEAQMNYTKKDERQAFHMCFLGNPGTGKTTVSKIMAGFLYKYKYIKKNQYIYTDASNIIACSDPTRKMKLILQKSHGNLIFIDEAYCFYQSRQGYEALTLLLNEMENSRNNMIIILAGYKKEMKELFSMNSGLQSRFNTYLFFEDYTQNEMMDILHYIADGKHYKISPAAEKLFIDEFIWQKCLPSFANARTVRKIFENTLSRHFYNLKNNIITLDKKYIICKEDVVTSLKKDNYFLQK